MVNYGSIMDGFMMDYGLMMNDGLMVDEWWMRYG
jgi:hypothetical protein